MTEDEWQQTYRDTIAKLQPGTKVKFYWNENNPNNRLAHIRAIVDDEQVVSRTWSKSKKRWIYKLEWWYWYWICFKNNHAKVVK